jgi:hypothetical protein
VVSLASRRYHGSESSLTVLGIFAYCSYLVEKDRKYICDVLCNGLARQEYRGYDSAGEHRLVCPP